MPKHGGFSTHVMVGLEKHGRSPLHPTIDGRILPVVLEVERIGDPVCGVTNVVSDTTIGLRPCLGREFKFGSYGPRSASPHVGLFLRELRTRVTLLMSP